ncbi:MAG: hypothetical protein WCC59_17960 [Terriglobales bacterium]
MIVERNYKKVILMTPVAIVALAAVMYLVITSPRSSLRHFLREIGTVQIGKTTLEDWRKQVAPAHLSNVTFTCIQRACSVSWDGNNRLLHRLRLAPLSSVKASIEFQDGIASDIYIWTEIDDARDARGVMYLGTGATVHQTGNPQACNKHYFPDLKLHGNREWGTVTMDSCVSSEDRAKALAINTSCLTTIGGCKTAKAILPKVFGRF